jgi:uncharacterized membrane protein
VAIRNFTPKRRDFSGISVAQRTILYSLLGIYILFQIAYPLTSGDFLFRITVATILIGTVLAYYHAILNLGIAWATTYLLIIYFYASVVELIGLHTGWPFGKYIYDKSLGYSFDHLPVLVPLAWITLAYPVSVMMRKSNSSWRFLYGAIGIALWDLFLDPLMVKAHRWHWLSVKPNLPISREIPLSNPFGWLLAGIGLMGILSLLPTKNRKTNPNIWAPYLTLLWTLFSGIIGNLFFFHHPLLAVVGGFLFFLWFIPMIFKVQLGTAEI